MVGAMKDHRRKRGGYFSWLALFFWSALALVFFSGFAFSFFRLNYFRDGIHPKLVSSWQSSAIEAVSGDSPAVLLISVRETVVFPDQVLVFLEHPSYTRLFTKLDIQCLYFAPNSSQLQLKVPPLLTEYDEDLDHQIVRCPLLPQRWIVTVDLRSHGALEPGPTHDWNWLAYEAVVDRDNSTIVFVKGLNLKARRASNASRFECVYGWDFDKKKFLLRSEVISIAQEIVRCKTPLSLLNSQLKVNGKPIKVSVRAIGRGVLHSIARLKHLAPPEKPYLKQYQMCVCTMLRNQARVLREWVLYHSRIGVQRWFIYDNNSNDDIEDVIDSLVKGKVNITRHLWPWIKSQEAGFAHCALRARNSCEWVGFIDVDEFLHFPSGISLNGVLNNQSRPSSVVELRTSCHSFGPSGLNRVPMEGVTIGYTCRLVASERHKSLVKPEELNTTLINMVHHFHLRDGFKYVNIDRNIMVINHYKYQVWEVFKEKFHRRVATYVSDWQVGRNVGSKDRAPGLGTRAVEPHDWSSRFCEVRDRGLRNRVVEMFADPQTGLLPWQNKVNEVQNITLIEQKQKTRRSSRGLL